MKPLMKNSGLKLAKDLFINKKDLKNTDNMRINKNCDDTNHA